jgi:hypothetical protein
MKKILLRVALILLIVYVAAVAGLAYAMSRPPETFGRIMKHAPTISYIILPFEPLWLRIRAGGLKPGDPAPDFTLKTVDHSREVKLSSFRGQKPVVLVFGSYT